jgi:hypothetical protein
MIGWLTTALYAGPEAAFAGTPARDALLRVAGCTPRQAMISTAIVAVIGALAWQLHAPAWIGIFGILLAPLVLVGLVTRFGRRALRPNASWTAIWCLLLILIGAAAWLTLPAYRQWMNVFELDGLGDGQVLGCAVGFGLLMLGVPLSQIQGQAAALRLATLEQAAMSAELKALQAQIEPHFLYNTLANTRYLARHDPEKAVQMLDHLIAYLHSALPDMRGSGSTLGREFELAEHYLALMAIRFGARLSYELDCPAALRSASMPPLMLMSLVENAVQHGVEPMPGAVRVRLRAWVFEQTLCIVVSDDGAGASAKTLGSGVGLRNLRARLQAQFNGAASFALRMNDDCDTEAELRLPLELRA